MNLYFSGIGGIGISALAQYCLQQGHAISGSEISDNPLVEKLEGMGVEISLEQVAENVTNEIDVLVYTEAVPPTNPERQQAEKLGIPQKSYFQYLGEVSQTKRTIAVAGTHGKTTTVGMIATGFISAGFDATVFIGSTLPEFEHANFYSGSNNWLLVEACEYRNNFQFLAPEIVVLTNVEYDHPDAYESEEHYLQTMADFCAKSKTVIYHPDPISEKILADYNGQKIAVSVSDMELSVAGRHNRENASLAFALADHLALVNFGSGVQSFSGTGRRQEFLGDKDSIHVYDDYGHHPTEIRVTIEAFREKYPDAKIGLVYEPHQYSRTRQFKEKFLEAFEMADCVGVYPIYEARDTDEDKASVSRDDLLLGDKHVAIDTVEDVTRFCQKLSPGDVLLFMGAGKISQFGREFLQS